MTIATIVTLLARAGAELALDKPGGPVRVRGPKPVTERLAPEIRANRSALIEVLDLETRLQRGMDEFLRPMEAVGKVAIPEYARRLRHFEGLLARYESGMDGQAVSVRQEEKQ